MLTATCLQGMLVLLHNRPPIPFDVLSIDIGITPSKVVPGSSNVATPVKPISGYDNKAVVCLLSYKDNAACDMLRKCFLLNSMHWVKSNCNALCIYIMIPH